MRTAAVLALAASLAAVTVLASGAAAKPASPRASGATVKLGFITKFPVDFFFVLQNAAKKWDKAHKDATVIFAQGKSATDDAGEIAAIQDMVAKGVKGIAITPTSPAVSRELDKAVKKGIKVVLIDNDIPAWKKKTAVVATNNYKGGLLAGRYLATRLKAGDTLGILEGVPGVPALDDRVRGMLAGLGPLRTQIKVVARLATDCAQDKGLTAAQDILTRTSDVTAIYAACGPPALGAVEVLKNAGKKQGEVILVGFDALPDEVAQIRAGWETASVAQFPAKMGLLGIDTTYKAVKGKKVPKNVDTGTALVTKANAARFGG
ncbi:MAG TPA: sugar ABC transporter substrate-binding protein [Gaiellaceae bacterium]|nr:sugar ABC transporter substrate-binding protein [Gaiellaceae bacterium]